MKKKIILGTSDTWSMTRLSHRPSEPAYYIEDFRISTYMDSRTIWCLITWIEGYFQISTSEMLTTWVHELPIPNFNIFLTNKNESFCLFAVFFVKPIWCFLKFRIGNSWNHVVSSSIQEGRARFLLTLKNR